MESVKQSKKIITLGFASVENDQLIHHWNKTGDSTYDAWLTRQLKDERHAQKGLVNFEEDGEKLIHYINEFHRLKKQKQIRGIDINKLDFPGLKNVVEKNKNKISKKALERGKVDLAASGDYQINIYKSVNDAAKVAGHGKGTFWCTENVDTARSYLQKGAIYVITKHGKSFAQLHVETQQYMDVNDSPINSEMWQELSENIPFINQLINRMGILEAMTVDEIYSWIESKGPHIEGDLDLRWIKITKLPDSLKSIGGYLDLAGTKITKLPDSLVSVGGYLDLCGTQITEFPDSLVSVGGYLDLRWTQITKLPDSLVSVGGYLDLRGTQVTKLPDSLVSVGGYLDLRGTPITKLPDSLVVKGEIIR